VADRGLAVALLVVIGLGAWVYSDHRQTVSQQKAVAVVTAYVNAVNANDMTAVKAAQTSDNSWMSVANGSVVDGPYKAEAQVTHEIDWLSSGLNLATVGTPLVSSDIQVVVQAHATFRSDPSAGGSGAITYTLRNAGSGLKVSSAVFVVTSSN
jgi:ketosteroid isomerase-like protein